MKFDVVIGNPPYQEEQKGDNDFARPIYHLFAEMAFNLSDKVTFITPGRFLFRAGRTPSAWNEKMLLDPHLKVLYYEEDSSVVFPNTDIKGGVAIWIRDLSKDFGEIGTFTKYPELHEMIEKASPKNEKQRITSIISVQNKYNLENVYSDHPELKSIIGSDGTDKRLRNNAFKKVSLFHRVVSETHSLPVYGLLELSKGNYRRTIRYIDPRYIDTDHHNLSGFKLLVARSSGSGVFGETLSNIEIAKPGSAYTQTYIGIGPFENEIEALNARKYLQTKFSRALLGVLKTTQDNNKDTWKMIPVQDFTENSDIRWSADLEQIDNQLFQKYELSSQLVLFIKNHVQEMRI